MSTEKEMLEMLEKGALSLPPLAFRSLNVKITGMDRRLIDALAEACWGRRRARFAVVCRALATPKAVGESVGRLRAARLPRGFLPLLFVPYLNDQRLLELEREAVSAVDLCGNGVVVASGLFSVFRGGKPNRFPSSAPIKNVYRKNSSMVGRAFLRRPRFATVQEVCNEVNEGNLLVRQSWRMAMSLSTVSKVLKALEEDLIIARAPAIGLLQADKLLQKLAQNFTVPLARKTIRLKVTASPKEIRERLWQAAAAAKLPLIASGGASVGMYATMQREELLTVYCPDAATLLAKIPGSPTERFPNLEVRETADETVFFDSRQAEGFRWASPVQAYLELMAGDQRDRETAGQVKELILAGLREQ